MFFLHRFRMNTQLLCLNQLIIEDNFFYPFIIAKDDSPLFLHNMENFLKNHINYFGNLLSLVM